MPKLVVNGAKLKCDQGTSPGSLTVLPVQGTSSEQEPGATVDDHLPISNIPTFGMCQTESNPEVAAATSAAQGVLTPQPCVPVTTSAWSPGSSVVTINGTKALTDDSTCRCNWTGNISIADPAATIELD
jgi:hypothetical protein